MGYSELIDYLSVKYAEDDEFNVDISFGRPINAEKTRILKDKLVLIYDKLAAKITSLPAFIQLNKELKEEPYLYVFQSLIDNLVINIEHSTLKEGFSYAVRMIDALNELRKEIRSEIQDKDKKVMLDLAIKNIQDNIWKESKSILNIHDLRGLELSYPELKGIVNEIVPTWQYGKGKNPTKPAIKQNDMTINNLMKKLQKEIDEEKSK